jgi:phosphoglycerate dehydrogenase-like enzyme
MILALRHRMRDLDDAQRASRWEAESLKPKLASLLGETVLIIGYGEIGKEVARRLLAFGAEVTAVARSPRLSEGVRIYASEDLPALVASAGIVVLARPAADDGSAIVDAAFLRAMRRDAVLINVGRGNLVDEQALIEALRAGEIGSAALDVFTTEPLPAESPLWRTPGLIVSPHIAGFGDRNAVRRMASLVASNAVSIARGEAPLGLVDA